VFSIGVDAPDLPDNLLTLLSPAPAYLAAQPVVGLWPVSALRSIEAILEGSGKHSMRAFAETIGAKPVQLAADPANINTPADLAEAEKRRGL
jgi:molybdopterin-guanine dinucleotide biosynthesis protein A